jgi:hypothetical protein
VAPRLSRRARIPRPANLPLPSLPSLPALPPLPGGIGRPRPAASTEIHNYRVMRWDSVAMGIINAASTFLPVFVARLGGSAFHIGLLTAIPAVSGFLLAIPIGQFLQRRTGIVSWYSQGRMIAHFAYLAIALAVFFAPPAAIVPAALLIWALASVPSTIGTVSFPVVMDGAAGPRGRMELMSRRWSVMGLTTAVTVAVIGQILDRLPFPMNYQLVFAGFTLAGLVSYQFSRQFRVPSHEPPPAAGSFLGRIRDVIAIVRAAPAFLHYSARQLVYVVGIRLVLPLIPLYYVRVVGAPDAWIGIIATVQSLALLVGYLFWRGQSRIRGTRFVLLATLLVSALHPALLSLTDQLVVVAALAGTGALFAAGVDLALFDQLMRTIPRTFGVTFASVDTMLVNGATIIAPLLGAALAEQLGIEVALRLGTFISLSGCLLFILAAREERPEAAAVPISPAP